MDLRRRTCNISRNNYTKPNQTTSICSFPPLIKAKTRRQSITGTKQNFRSTSSSTQMIRHRANSMKLPHPYRIKSHRASCLRILRPTQAATVAFTATCATSKPKLIRQSFRTGMLNLREIAATRRQKTCTTWAEAKDRSWIRVTWARIGRTKVVAAPLSASYRTW